MNRNSKLLGFVIMAAVLLAVSISSGYGGEEDEKLPKMYIHKTNVDLGEFYEGVDIEHTFKVRNNGSAILEVHVRPG